MGIIIPKITREKLTTTEQYPVDIFNVTENVKTKVEKVIPINSTLKIELNKSIESMSQDEFEKFLNETITNNGWTKQLDLSELIKNKKLHYYLYNIVWNNFPLIWISRLLHWQKVLDLTFLQIKDLNDTITKESVDLFIWKFKQKIKSNFEQTVDWELPGRLVRNNYKHLTFSLRNNLDIRKKIFDNKNQKLV